ncbi:GDP-mannose 4,6-dehydratase [Chelativorans sp. M5D2P16]|uniref:GDP-mannose 4,6-dehydratase n=1 Tax=Chelativorans sp. M5D2P16 TaxID=3095678 RepID=UPI002ACA5319|nr:GDP-mannose 4,6-dehydratase [Chelativorans sp. M5D2P16]MDZ5699960.1 GDP-mannose 4,6-dehydratase [Chelativorans sp. M5D2P16]
MHVLITGGAGFVGSHVVQALRQVFGDRADLIVTSKGAAHADAKGLHTLDVTDREAVRGAIEHWQPAHVIHLAGVAAPRAAAADPDLAWRVHVFGALNLAHAILDKAPHCQLVHVGSGLIYGDSARAGVPLDESAVPAPLDDYGVTKAAADLAIGALAQRGLRSVRFRPFNHTGPGQSEDFVVPAFAMQIARIEAGLAEPVLRVGNLDSERDFLDVRDVALCYALAVAKADSIEPGTILNVASGKALRIGSILDMLLSLATSRIKVEPDPARMRASDIQRVVGDASRAQNLLGWKPSYRFEQTLADILDDSRHRVAGQGL